MILKKRRRVGIPETLRAARTEKKRESENDRERQTTATRLRIIERDL